MPSTYTVNLGIEKPATGEQSGTWGDTTNVNFDILDQAINGAERVTLTSAGSSGSPNSLQITNGATSDGRNKWLEFYSSSDLGGSAFVQLDPNDAEKIVFVRNSLAGSQSVILFQGTYNAARDLEVPAGVDMVVKFDGGGASAATVTDVFTKLRATEITTPTLTAGTADINGGTVDGSVIGGSSAAAITGTTVTANTSLNIAGDGATVTGIKDEDDMSSNSPTKLATQQSIKAYVDSQVGTVDTWAEVLANGATSGSTNPEVTAGQALKTNTINETSAGSGVTIDSVLLKDDVVNATDIEVSSISANDGTEAATLANSTGVMTIASSVLTTTDINGGSIDGTNIGASSAGTGAFTTLDASGAFTGTTATFTTDGNTAQLTLVSTDADAGVGPVFDLTRNSASPAADDGLAQIRFNGQDSGGNELSYAHMRAFIVDPTDGSEDGKFEIDVRQDGGQRSRLLLDSTETVFNQESRNFDFRVESDSNTHALFVDAGNDRVGINTSAPATTFEVTGNARVVNSGTTALTVRSTVQSVAGGQSTMKIGSSDTAAADKGGSLNFTANTTSSANYPVAGISGLHETLGSGNYSGYLALYTTTSAGSISESYRIDSVGDLLAKRADARIGSSVGAVEYGTSTSNSVRFYSNDTERARFAATTEFAVNEPGNDYDFRVESNANTHMLYVNAGLDQVAIGSGSITAPSGYHFFSYGAGSGARSAFVHGAGDGGIVVSGAAGGSAASVIFGNNWGTNGATFSEEWRLYMNGADDTLQFNHSENATKAMVLTPTSRVGINEPSPDYQLHVNSGTSNVVAKFESTDATSVIQFVDSSGNSEFGTSGNTARISPNGSYAVLEASQSAVVINNAAQDCDFRVESGSNTHMLFINAGTNKIGINSSNPQTILEIIDSNPKLRLEDSASGSKRIDIGVTSGAVAFVDAPQSAQTLKNSVSGTESLTQYHNTNGVVVNEGGADRDFRVESDNITSMLMVDAAQDEVYVGGVVDLGASVMTVTAATGAHNSFAVGPGGNNSVTLGNFTNGDEIANLITSSSKFGSVIQGGENGSLVLGIRDNDTTDGIFIISGTGTGGGQMSNGYSRLKFSVTPNIVVINETGDDSDFRVETDATSNAFVVNAGTDAVEVGAQNAILTASGHTFNYTGLTVRNTGTATSSSHKSQILFDVYGSGGNATRASIVAGKTDSGSTNGFLRFDVLDSGTVETRLSLRPDEVVVNDESYSVDFRVESDTDNAALFVDASTSRVGINQNAPATHLHVKGTNDTDGAALILQEANNNTSDTIGTIFFGNNSDSTLGRIIGFTSGSATTCTLRFMSTSNGGNAVNNLDLAASNVTFNENAADCDFRVESDNSSYGIYLDAANDRLLVGRGDVSTGEDFFAVDAKPGTSGQLVRTGRDDNSTKNHFVFMNPNGAVGSIQTAASQTLYNTSSDARLKENITDADDAGALIDAIQVRQFDWIEDGEHQRYGMVAQELNTVAPEAVSEGETEEDMMAVDYSKLVPMLVKEIQTLRSRIADLES